MEEEVNITIVFISILHNRGLEPRPRAWEARILPLN